MSFKTVPNIDDKLAAAGDKPANLVRTIDDVAKIIMLNIRSLTTMLKTSFDQGKQMHHRQVDLAKRLKTAGENLEGDLKALDTIQDNLRNLSDRVDDAVIKCDQGCKPFLDWTVPSWLTKHKDEKVQQKGKAMKILQQRAEATLEKMRTIPGRLQEFEKRGMQILAEIRKLSSDRRLASGRLDGDIKEMQTLLLLAEVQAKKLEVLFTGTSNKLTSDIKAFERTKPTQLRKDHLVKIKKMQSELETASKNANGLIKTWDGLKVSELLAKAKKLQASTKDFRFSKLVPPLETAFADYKTFKTKWLSLYNSRKKYLTDLLKKTNEQIERNEKAREAAGK